MVKEVRDKVIVYCKTEDENWEMYLETLQFFAEEYYEPQERKTCPTCKHKQECMTRAKESGIILLGDFCARYEEKGKTTKITPCAKCKRFEKCKQSTMKTRTWLNSGLGSCAIFEEKE